MGKGIFAFLLFLVAVVYTRADNHILCYYNSTAHTREGEEEIFVTFKKIFM